MNAPLWIIAACLVFRTGKDAAASLALWKLNRRWRAQQGNAPSSVNPQFGVPVGKLGDVVLPDPKEAVVLDEFLRVAMEAMKRQLRDESDGWRGEGEPHD